MTNTGHPMDYVDGYNYPTQKVIDTWDALLEQASARQLNRRVLMSDVYTVFLSDLPEADRQEVFRLMFLLTMEWLRTGRKPRNKTLIRNAHREKGGRESS